MRLSEIPVPTPDEIAIWGITPLKRLLRIFDDHFLDELDDADGDIKFFYYEIKNKVAEISDAVEKQIKEVTLG